MTRTEIRRLAFAAFWAIVAIALMFRTMAQNNADVLPNGNGGLTVDTGTMVALALCAWNVLLWFLAARSRPVSADESPLIQKKPLQPRGDKAFEYNPEFDFQKPEGPEPSGLPPADSRNGNHAHPPEEPPVNRIGG